jgi:hypothetical protein
MLGTIYTKSFLIAGLVGAMMLMLNGHPVPQTLDYSVWGCMKDFVYMVPILSENHLIERILQAGQQFRLKPHIFQRLRFSLIRRARMCIQKNGGHIEQFL